MEESKEMDWYICENSNNHEEGYVEVGETPSPYAFGGCCGKIGKPHKWKPWSTKKQYTTDFTVYPRKKFYIGSVKSAADYEILDKVESLEKKLDEKFDEIKKLFDEKLNLQQSN